MAIDQSKIVDAVCEMNPHGNEEGIIDVFGVYLTNHYADYYNRISYRFEKELSANDKNLLDIAKFLLIEAGHVCGFNTFGGIRKSDAWKALIQPMCENKEDEIRGLVAVLNALGWGIWEVKEVSKDKLVIKSDNTYESVGFIREFGKAEDTKCYLATGVAASFMNIVYQDNVYEDMKANAFIGNEVKCRSKGDPYCEIVVSKK